MKNYSIHCPSCGSLDINMIGEPEFNDYYECEECCEYFSSPEIIEVD